MNIKLYKKALALALAGGIVLSNGITAHAVELPTPVEEEVDGVEYNTVIQATANVFVRKLPTTASESIGLMSIDEQVSKVGEYDNFYIVNYNNQIGYVSKDYSKEEVVTILPPQFEKLVYVNKPSTPVYDNILGVREIDDILQYEVCEVLGELNGMYYVNTNGVTGCVRADDCTELSDKVVVVDISDQHLKYYENNRLTLESDVVTGGPGHETNMGYHEIIQIRKNTRLKGPGWNVPVDVYAKFDADAEGFHDASWRPDTDFGGETYLTNGSHGCVNMPKENAKTLVKKLTVGDQVIIKR